MSRQLHSLTNMLKRLGIIRKPKQARVLKGFNRRLWYEQCEDRRMLTTFMVNVDYDASAPFNLTDNIVTLREAIFRANQLPASDIINFDSTLNGVPITLGKDANGNSISTGQLNITESLTIKGEDPNGNLLNITVDANGNDPTPNSTWSDGINNDQDGSGVFSIFKYRYGGGTLDVTMRNLTITGGDVPGLGGGIEYQNHGGGSLNLIDVKLIDNHAQEGGGLAIRITGSETAPVDVRIETSEISGNTSGLSGGAGGIYMYSRGGEIELIESTISGNSSVARGGGVFALLSMNYSDMQRSSFNMSQSTIANNVGGDGGGMYISAIDSDVEILQSTFSNNVAHSSNVGGGGLGAKIDRGLLLIDQSTFNTNAATRYGGGLNVKLNGGNLTMVSSEVSGNNSQSSGGGMLVEVADGSIVIDQSVFEENEIEGTDFYSGGALYLTANNSETTISNTTISNNQALGESNFGGALFNIISGSTLLMDRLAVVDNHANDDVGGLGITSSGSTATLHNSTISGNTATHNDTQIYYDAASGMFVYTDASGTALIENSSIVGNRTITPPGQPKENVDGAGLVLLNRPGTTTTIRNTTVSGNQAEGSGGGIKLTESIYGGGNVLIEHSTITNNRANYDGDPVGTGGGIHVGNSLTTLTLSHTIVAGNFRGTGTTRSDIVGSVTASWSLVGDNTGATISGTNNLIGTAGSPRNPGLAALANNGGPTKTHRPVVGSQAIDAGNPSITSPPQFDQRGTGFTRVANGDSLGGARIDIGAFEYDFNRPLTITDVIIKGTQTGSSTLWDPSAWVSMNDRIQDGDQFKSIYTQGANEIEIQLSKPVTSVNQNRIQLLGSNGRSIPITSAMLNSLDPTKVTITFQPLLIDKYALHIFDDAFSETLDGEWANLGHNDTLDDVSDDTAPAGGFAVGNGTTGAFRLHFAYLPGDYNGNGFVESLETGGDGDGNGTPGQTADNTIRDKFVGFYRDQRQSIAGFDYDFDGNITNDADDLAHWNAIRLRADFNGDNNTSGSAAVTPSMPGDLTIWQTNYGVGSGAAHAQGDADYDQDVDGRDFLIWSQEYTRHTGWYIAPPVVAPSTISPPPKVTNVVVSGSTSAHAPYHVPAFHASGDQLLTVPVGKADTYSIVFSQDLVVTASDLVVVGMRTANVPQLAAFSYDALSFTGTWRFTGWTLGDNFLLFLNDTVQNAEGIALDGEWTNPASVYAVGPGISEFPSGDGVEGGAFAFVVTLLPGDINLDNEVNEIDQYMYVNSLQQGGGTLFVHGDFNGSGTVSNMETGSLANNWLASLQTLVFVADMDGDLDVDNDDLDVIGENLGMTGATQADGDVDGDGAVTTADLDMAFEQWGLWILVA